MSRKNDRVICAFPRAVKRFGFNISSRELCSADPARFLVMTNDVPNRIYCQIGPVRDEKRAKTPNVA